MHAKLGNGESLLVTLLSSMTAVKLYEDWTMEFSTTSSYATACLDEKVKRRSFLESLQPLGQSRRQIKLCSGYTDKEGL